MLPLLSLPLAPLHASPTSRPSKRIHNHRQYAGIQKAEKKSSKPPLAAQEQQRFSSLSYQARNGGLSQLYKAVEHKSETEVKALLESGARYDAPVWNGWSLLEAAADANDLNMQSYIIQSCRDVRKISGANNGMPLIRELIRAHNAKKYPAFVKNGFAASGISPEEDTLLYHAVQMKYAPTVQVLLDHKADPKKLTLDGRSLLDIATANQDEATVKLLQQAIAGSYPEGLEGMYQLNLSSGSRVSAEDEEMTS